MNLIGVLLKEIFWGVVTSVAVDAFMGTPHYAPPQQEKVIYQIVEKEPNKEDAVKEYVSKFNEVSEPITKEELKGNYYGEVNGKAQILRIDNLKDDGNKITFYWAIFDTNLQGSHSTGGKYYPEYNALTLDKEGFEELACGVHKVKCSENSKTYIIFGVIDDKTGKKLSFMKE